MLGSHQKSQTLYRRIHQVQDRYWCCPRQQYWSPSSDNRSIRQPEELVLHDRWQVVRVHCQCSNLASKFRLHLLFYSLHNKRVICSVTSTLLLVAIPTACTSSLVTSALTPARVSTSSTARPSLSVSTPSSTPPTSGSVWLPLPLPPPLPTDRSLLDVGQWQIR